MNTKMKFTRMMNGDYLESNNRYMIRRAKGGYWWNLYAGVVSGQYGSPVVALKYLADVKKMSGAIEAMGGVDKYLSAKPGERMDAIRKALRG